MGRLAQGLGPAPLVLAAVGAGMVSTIVFVHHNQESEKLAMREGVKRDIEREKERRTQLKEQAALRRNANAR